MQNIVQSILDRGATSPLKPAVDFYGDTWTYQRLAQAIQAWAARFSAAGLGSGDIVLVFLPQTPEAIAVYFGLMSCAAVPSFMPLPSAKQEPAHYWASHRKLLEVIRPAALVTMREHRPAMLDAGFETVLPHVRVHVIEQDWGCVSRQAGIVEVTDGQLALLQHSSGTTSLKKGVALSHRAITQQVAAYAKALNATSDDVVASWLPMYHDMGLIACTVTPLLLGQKIVLLDPFRWVAEPRSLLDAIESHRCTLTWLPNFAFELLVRTTRSDVDSLDLSSMRAFIDCSEPCKAASFDRFLKKFSPAGVTASMLHVSYAMAETVFAVTQTPLGSAAPRFIVDADVLSGQKLAAPAGSSSPAVELLSAGAPLQGISVFISDDAGAVLPTDQVGEIELVGDFLFEGYFNRPELTSARFRNGRYRTGDIGFVHEGEVYVLGRTDDLIIVHGRNYLAHEIEAVTNGIPGLKAGRNVAISVFNDAMGSLDVVVIAETGDARLPEGQEQLGLKRAVKRSVAAQMGLELRDVLIVPSGWLVKTTSGKISRSLNRERYLQELARRHPMNQGVHIHE